MMLLFSYSFNRERCSFSFFSSCFCLVLFCLLFVGNTTLYIHKGIQIIN